MTPAVMAAVAAGRKLINDRVAAAERARRAEEELNRRELAAAVGSVEQALAREVPGWDASFAEHLGHHDNLHLCIRNKSETSVWVDLPGCYRVSIGLKYWDAGCGYIFNVFGAQVPSGNHICDSFAEAVAVAFERRQEAIRYAAKYDVPPGQS